MPIYRQIANSFIQMIEKGTMVEGERLPATRELAGQLGLNRATVSAGYALLEQWGVIEGHVGRGSFVSRRTVAAMGAPGLDWDAVLTPLRREEDARRDEAVRIATPATAASVQVNFASSRPDQGSFPLSSFRALTKEVIDGPEASEILQLGSPYGYGPLRRFLREQAVAEGTARSSDQLLMTNGCQQALDLLARLFAAEGGKPDQARRGSVVVEDPVYHGLLRVFSRTNMNVLPVPVGASGLDLGALEETLIRSQPRLLVVTPSFHNPTGATLGLEDRKRLVRLAQTYKVVLVENDIYSQLRYVGKPLPSLKQLDESGNTIMLRSYSKVAFPGLRVGWVIGPREVIARLAEEKQIADLHSDQLSQAVLLRFAESGQLEQHLEQTRLMGAQRLRAVLDGCRRYLPPGTVWTTPEGGMSLWVELPAPLLAESLLRRAKELGVDFMPGYQFSTQSAFGRALRISFGGLSPASIEHGMRLLGEAAAAESASREERFQAEPAMALV